MGNKCTCFSATSSTDEAEDALLGNVVGEERQVTGTSSGGRSSRRRRNTAAAATVPRGPPPPYQQVSQVHPFYMLTEDQRLQIIARITLIQSLPVGRYEMNKKPHPSSLGMGDTTTNSSCSSEKKIDKSDSTRECPICMNDFLPGEVIRLLPCMHYYHIRCIDDWLMRAITCPTCVQRIDAVPHNSAHQPHPPHRHNRSNSQGSVRRSVDPLTPPPSNSTPPLSPMSLSPPPPPTNSQQQFVTSAEIH